MHIKIRIHKQNNLFSYWQVNIIPQVMPHQFLRYYKYFRNLVYFYTKMLIHKFYLLQHQIHSTLTELTKLAKHVRIFAKIFTHTHT